MIVELGPKINFIVGHNGSGKSAILTALSICLGGKASGTQRAASLKQFIREGTSRALISVTLNNTGEEAYNPEQYGDAIIIERVIERAGTSHYKAKSAAGKIIGHTKDALLDILDHFEIIVDNPLAILSQDMARSFLNGVDTNQLYKFLSNGIQHEVWKKLYTSTVTNVDEATKAIPVLKEQVAIRSARVGELQREHTLLENQKIEAQRLGRIAAQIQWKNVELKEFEIQDQETLLEELQSESNAIENQINIQHKAITESKLNIEAIVKQRPELLLVKDTKAQELQRAKAEFMDVRDQLRQHDATLDELKLAIRTRDSKIKDLQIRLQKEKHQMEGGYEQDRVKWEKSKTEKMKTIQDLELKIAEWKSERNNLEDSLSQLRNEIKDHENDFREARTEVEQYMEALENMDGSEAKFMNRFGPSIGRVLKEIEEEKRFTAKPIGPIGAFITLKKSEWTSILTRVFDNTLESFVVQNSQDMNLLRHIMNRNHMDSPIIISAPDLYDIELPDRQYTTIYDILEFSNDHLKRVMIDRHKINAIIIETNRQMGEKIMLSRPRNVISCFAMTGRNECTSITNTKGSSSTTPVYGRLRPYYLMREESKTGQKDNITSLLEEAKAKYQLANKQYRKIKEQLTSNERGINFLKNKINEAQITIDRLKRDVDKLDDKLSQEIDDSVITTLNDNIVSLQEEQNTDLNQLRDAETARVELKNNVDDYNSLMEAISQQLKSAESELHRNVRAENDLNSKFIHLESKIKKLQHDLDSQHQRVDAQKQHIANLNAELNDLIRAAKEKSEERLRTLDTLQTLESKYMELRNSMEAAKEMSKHRDITQVIRELKEATEAYKIAKEQFSVAHRTVQKLQKMQKERKAHYDILLAATTSNIIQTFNQILDERDFEGKLEIDHVNQTMSIGAAPRARGEGSSKNTKSLSGGEKSFSQIALLLAVWSAMSCRLRGLDEFDVFMDEVNRKFSMKLMIEAIYSLDQGQTIFITPNNMADIKVNKNDVTILRLADPKR